MFSGKYTIITILLSSTTLIVVVSMIITTIALLIMGKQYNKHLRRLIIGLLIIALGFGLYLVYLAFAFGNPHPSAQPVPFR